MLHVVAFKVMSDALWAYLVVLDVPYKPPRTTPLLPHPFTPISLFISPSLPNFGAESSSTLTKSCGTGASMGFPHAHSSSRCSLCSRTGFYQHCCHCFFSASHLYFFLLLRTPPSWSLSAPFVPFFPSFASSHPPPILPLLVKVHSFVPIFYSFLCK